MNQHIEKKFSKSDPIGSKCHTEWTSLEYYQCIDQFMEKLREAFDCFTVFDIALSKRSVVIPFDQIFCNIDGLAHPQNIV